MTADTSVVVAALSSWHEQHEVAAPLLRDVHALPAHAALEVFSVLTRLPRGLALTPADAERVLSATFAEPPLVLPAAARKRLLRDLAGASIGGGAAYDALVGLEARAHDQVLVTLDRRALDTYRRLDVRARLLAA
jgi:predicted nucleic acid-binding protein